jgi:hypothetical protein
MASAATSALRAHAIHSVARMPSASNAKNVAISVPATAPIAFAA